MSWKSNQADVPESLSVARAVASSTPERYRDVEGNAVPTPWVGSFGSYEEVEGMRVPTEGEVEWIVPEGRLSYWRGRIIRFDYDFGE